MTEPSSEERTPPGQMGPFHGAEETAALPYPIRFPAERLKRMTPGDLHGISDDPVAAGAPAYGRRLFPYMPGSEILVLTRPKHLARLVTAGLFAGRDAALARITAVQALIRIIDAFGSVEHRERQKTFLAQRKPAPGGIVNRDIHPVPSHRFRPQSVQTIALKESFIADGLVVAPIGPAPFPRRPDALRGPVRTEAHGVEQDHIRAGLQDRLLQSDQSVRFRQIVNRGTGTILPEPPLSPFVWPARPPVRLMDHAGDIRQASGLLVANGAAAVRGAVVDQHDLIVFFALVRDGIHASAQIVFDLTDRDQDAEKQRVASFGSSQDRTCIGPAEGRQDKDRGRRAEAIPHRPVNI